MYPENNRKVLSKLCLGSEQTMETNTICASSGCPKNVDNSKQIRLLICKDLHVSNCISFERETPNWVTWRYMTRTKKEWLYLRWTVYLPTAGVCREPRSANVFFAESPRFCSRQKSRISAKDVFPVVNLHEANIPSK